MYVVVRPHSEVIWKVQAAHQMRYPGWPCVSRRPGRRGQQCGSHSLRRSSAWPLRLVLRCGLDTSDLGYQFWDFTGISMYLPFN
jgi:hypothetical protein